MKICLEKKDGHFKQHSTKCDQKYRGSIFHTFLFNKIKLILLRSA